jgi:MoxR-like ATPase
VVDLIVDLRAYLQDKCEPPVYVSDRRLVKSIALLRVAAYTNGRSAVSEFDCLLLSNVLWQGLPDIVRHVIDPLHAC